MFRPCTFPVNLPIRHSLCLGRHNPPSIRRAWPLYCTFLENQILHGLSGRTENDRLGGRLGVSFFSPFFYTASAQSDTDFIIFVGGQNERTLNLIYNPQQVSLYCSLFNATRAWIGGVNQFTYSDGRADQTKGARTCEWLGVLPVRPFFTNSATYNSIFTDGKGNKGMSASAASWGMPFPFILSGAFSIFRPGTLTFSFFGTGDARKYPRLGGNSSGIPPLCPPFKQASARSVRGDAAQRSAMFRKKSNGGHRDRRRAGMVSQAVPSPVGGTFRERAGKTSAHSLLLITPKQPYNEYLL